MESIIKILAPIFLRKVMKVNVINYQIWLNNVSGVVRIAQMFPLATSKFSSSAGNARFVSMISFLSKSAQYSRIHAPGSILEEFCSF